MGTLPGIQSVPSGAPAEIRTILRQLRERALATGDQFSDAEAEALRNLLTTPATSNTPIPATTKGTKTTFLDKPYQFYDGVGTAVWTKFNGTDAGIPAGAVAVLLEARWVLAGRTGQDQRYALYRIDASKGAGIPPYADTFIITSGTGGRDSNVDGSGGFNQALLPLANDTTFEYLTNIAGFGWTSLLLRVIGYQAEVT